MSITFEQIMLDAQRMANRIKDLEALGNALLVEAEGNNRQIETMKQFQDDIDSLNKLARDKTNAEMVNRVNQQNPSLREFRQENRELKATLEDYQRALEIIMHKYREQIQHKVFTSRINFKEMYNAKLQDVILNQQEKINEMAAIMQKAASIDDGNCNNEIELITKLKVENQGLREMLQISKQFGLQSIGCVDKAVQTEIDEFFSKIENGTTDPNLFNESLIDDNTTILEQDNKNYHELSSSSSTSTIKKSITSSVATMTTTAEAKAVTTTTAVSNPPSTIISTAPEKTITTLINESNTKNSKTIEIEPKKSAEMANALVDIPSSGIPIVNGESNECKDQDQVS